MNEMRKTRSAQERKASDHDGAKSGKIESRRVLLCVAGQTPQIITETLWGLTQEHRLQIDEIHVITTPAGKRRIEETLWAGGKGKFFEFIEDYKSCAHIKFDESCLHLLMKDDDTGYLEDVLNAKDNECAANQIYKIVRRLSLEKTIIHATAAGGRKT